MGCRRPSCGIDVLPLDKSKSTLHPLRLPIVSILLAPHKYSDPICISMRINLLYLTSSDQLYFPIWVRVENMYFRQNYYSAYFSRSTIKFPAFVLWILDIFFSTPAKAALSCIYNIIVHNYIAKLMNYYICQPYVGEKRSYCCMLRFV